MVVVPPCGCPMSDQDMVQLGSNVYKVVPGAPPDHLAAARALAQQAGRLISLGQETAVEATGVARDDYRSSLDSYTPEEGVPPKSDVVAALNKQVAATLSAIAAEREALLAALQTAKANEQRALARVAELEAIYEPGATTSTLVVAMTPDPEPGLKLPTAVEATFTEPGSFGLKLNEYDPGDGLGIRAVVVKLNSGTQVEQHPQLHKGLVLDRVGDTDLRCSSYGEVLRLLKGCKQRPVTLRFTEQEP